MKTTTSPAIRSIEQRMRAISVPFSELCKFGGLDYSFTRRRMLSGRVDQDSLVRLSGALDQFETEAIRRLLKSPSIAPEAAARLRSALEIRLAEIDALLLADDELARAE
jgi:hypothetical protein